LGPIPNPQSPIPNPQSPIPIYLRTKIIKFFKYLIKNKQINIKYIKIYNEIIKEKMQNYLSKKTTKSKTITNENIENINKDSNISEKIYLNTDNDISPKNQIKEELINEKEIDKISLQTDYNEFSVFNYIEENQLKLYDDDKKIYNYLLKNYKTRENIDNFMNFFYPKGYKDTPHMKEVEFYLIGVFEDLAYYPVWMSDKLLEDAIQEFKSKYNIYYWRRIKGDGNCFYRSILINYIEILINNSIKNDNPCIFFSFLKEVFFTKFPKEINNFKKQLIIILLLIYEHIQKKSSFAYDILYRSIHKSQCIEKSLIFWLKLKLREFLKQNINLEINGLKLLQIIPEINYDEEEKKIILPENKELNEYIDNKILKMDEYVEGYPIYITPFILKCTINIYSLNKSCDKKDKKLYINKEKIDLPKDTMYIPVIEYLPNLNNEEINLLFRSPHYDSLSNREFVNNLVDNYINPYIILIEGLLSINEYEKYKTSIVEIWNEKNKKQNKNKLKDKSKHNSICSCYELYKDRIINDLKDNENEIEYKKFVNHTENECKSDSKKDIIKKYNFETKNAIKIYKALNKFKDSNISVGTNNSSLSLQIKYIECLTKCSICNEIMSHRLPCGCLICLSCSKKKIIMSQEDNNIKIPLSVCSCGYILNDKDQKIIINN
jgi:hypothetical protein